MIKKLIWYAKDLPFYYPLRTILFRGKANRDLKQWESLGKPIPPPDIVKHMTLLETAKTYNLSELVETGTYYGETISAMKKHFDKVYSIELSPVFHKKAQTRFKRDTNVELIYGDSGTELKNLLPKITKPALFWLDGHYSGPGTAKGEKDSPIYEELSHIFESSNLKHAIVIDDARCFKENSPYPTIEEITSFIQSHRPDYEIIIKYDSIRILPTEQ